MPEPTADWGLNYPDYYIVPAWEFWRLSNYTVYPNAMGYDDQPQDIIDDFVCLNEVYAYQVHHLKKPTANKPKSFSDL